jgi:hypothetical protein
MTVKIEYNPGRIVIPSRVVKRVEKAVIKLGVPKYLTRGKVMFQMHGRNPIKGEISKPYYNQLITRTLTSIKIQKDGKVYRYMKDGGTTFNGIRLVLEEV